MDQMQASFLSSSILFFVGDLFSVMLSSEFLLLELAGLLIVWLLLLGFINSPMRFYGLQIYQEITYKHTHTQTLWNWKKSSRNYCRTNCSVETVIYYLYVFLSVYTTITLPYLGSECSICSIIGPSKLESVTLSDREIYNNI